MCERNRTGGLALLWVAAAAFGQTSPPSTQLPQALLGHWTGTLEYRDYSEPATSTRRVKLPTWLSIEALGPDLRFGYVYDDGPSKTVTDVELVRIDTAGALYQVLGADGNRKESYTIAGLAALREGRGTLTMTGPGKENGAPAQIRATFCIGETSSKLPGRRRSRVSRLSSDTLTRWCGLHRLPNNSRNI